MADLRELYQQVILDHNKQPRNYRCLDRPDRLAHGHNPLCGDKITVYLALDGNRIREVTFEGSGCAISKASASMMTTSVKGKTSEEALSLFESFHRLVTGQPNAEKNDVLGKLAVFGGVSEFPARVKCASLAWHTLQAALENSENTVTTERPGEPSEGVIG